MKLEEGMYVRIINDIRAICIGIGKIKKIVQETIYVDMRDNLPMSFNKNQIAKASNNIIDLIEAGDYVNGFPVIHKENDILKCGLLVQFKENGIKSIVTKEQFESMKYSLGG